jgi:polyisoprenoid-binding protein YceI
MGLAGGVSGKVTFDPTAPKKISGKIVIESKSLHIANRGMKKKAQSEGWLDVENHPTIEFTLKSVSKSTALGEGKFELEVAGDFTCKGVTKPLATKVTATYLKDKLSERGGGKAGDLLILRSNFTIKRSDFGIKAGMGSMVVADEIQLRVSIVGTFKRE